jgi:pimeloyl-ACP methyl ester carboxylesterase
MSEATPSTDTLTVVLVHGAFADASSWSPVVERLQAQGMQVAAPPNPLRGIAHDSAYIASFLQQIPGPVLAVGHSYGGAVISNAATDGDTAAGTDVVRSMAERPGAEITQVDGSHVTMISQPKAVTDVIMTAAAAVDRPTVAAGGGK